MGFEKIVLNAATESGIDQAYFYEGTMFFAPDDCYPSTPDAIEKFIDTYRIAFRGTPTPRFSNMGDEIAVDFTV